MLTALLVS